MKTTIPFAPAAWFSRVGSWLALVIVVTIAIMVSAGVALAADKDPKQPKQPKVSAEIRHHQKVKPRPAGVSVEEHKKNLRSRGLKAEKLDREEVALYVTRALTPEEVQAFRARGIEINAQNWVPPVPGHHAHGFYLAEVPFNRLDELEQDERIARVESTEHEHQPQNDVARQVTRVDQVQAGTGLLSAYTGTGVRIAIADSSVDLSHPDFAANPPFEKYDMTTGDGIGGEGVDPWSTNVAPVYDNHGTHVSGTVVGSGANSGGAYRGVAPGASWAFYKIGNNVTGGAFETDEVEAINRAVAANCKIFTMSYGGVGGANDGSGAAEQAIDAAVAAGVTVFIAAANAADDARHASVSVASGTTSAPFGMTVANSLPNPITVFVGINVVWRDNAVPFFNIGLSCANLGGGESLTQNFFGVSARGTKSFSYTLTAVVPAAVVPASATRTYNLQVENANTNSGSPNTLVHCYTSNPNGSTNVQFTNPDPNYTIGSPAVADGAIAVAAYVHRTSWTACNDVLYSEAETQGQIATFSSRGPRIDGLAKPDVAAPGSRTISTISLNNSTLLKPEPIWYQIPNVGVAGCTYLAIGGTSMACPHAAGIGALILQARPGLSPAEVRTLLTTTTTNIPASGHDNIWGWGLVDAYDAVYRAQDNIPGVWVDFLYSGLEKGNYYEPFNTMAEAQYNAPSAGTTVVPRVRIKTGTSPEVIRLNKAMRVESYNGNVHIGN